MTGAELIAAERARQIAEEGYTAEHDHGHAIQITQAAQSYVGLALREQRGTWLPMDVPIMWPWDASYWKPTGDPVRDLTKAGALIAAAIDSLEAGA
jgi:hypothetical protein